MEKGMLMGTQPGIQGHVQLQSGPLYDLDNCNAWSCCTKPRDRLVTDVTARCQGPRNTNGMAVPWGDNRLTSVQGAKWAWFMILEFSWSYKGYLINVCVTQKKIKCVLLNFILLLCNDQECSCFRLTLYGIGSNSWI